VSQSQCSAADRGYPALQVAFLGRWDVEMKGLDRLARVAASDPDLTINVHTDLYMKRDKRAGRRLLRELPPNMVLRTPVEGEGKWEALMSLDGYLHMARWESFGNSIAEAMVCGTIPFLSPEMHLAAELAPLDLCVLLDPDDATTSSRLIRATLLDAERRLDLEQRVREFAQREYHEASVARRMLEAYGWD
jgi:glycosyltransferase involved in cell wall biosynthesis